MSELDYLVSFGLTGDFSRFRASAPGDYGRGDRVVVRSQQGLQLGLVMCRALVDHDSFIAPKPMGDLLRRATHDDETEAERMNDRGNRLFSDARRLATEHNLPLEIVDVEVTLDGTQATVSYLRDAESDYRELVRALSRQHDILIVMQNLTMPAEHAEEESGCGKPDCGQGGGGCSSCSSGGCSTGGCAAGAKKEDIAAYLAHLDVPPDPTPRTPLL